MVRNKCVFLKDSDFKASRTWYAAFCERHKIAMKGVSCTKDMTVREFLNMWPNWVAKERSDLLKLLATNAWSVDGCLDRRCVLNLDEVGIELSKKERKQAFVSNQDIVQVNNKSTTRSVKHRLLTIIITIPACGFIGTEYKAHTHCKPYLILPGMC